LILTMAHSILVAKPSRCAWNVVLLIVGFHATLFEGPRDRVSEVMVAAVNLKSFTRNRALDMQSNSGVNFVSDNRTASLWGLELSDSYKLTVPLHLRVFHSCRHF